jgi:hypothetical protein
MFDTIALIFVGWLLGILGQPIIDAVRKGYLKRDIKISIISELKEIQYRLVCNVYLINRRFGTIDKQLINWSFKILKEYKGAYSEIQVLEALERQQNLNEKQLASLGEIMKPDKSQAITLRKFSTPFLDYHIGSLSMFSPNYQLKLFEIKSQLGLLNDRIEDTNFYYKMTFEPNISSENYNAVRHDLEKAYKNVADKAKTIVDSISSSFN